MPDEILPFSFGPLPPSPENKVIESDSSRASTASNGEPFKLYESWRTSESVSIHGVFDSDDAVMSALILDFPKSEWVLEELTIDHFYYLKRSRKLFEALLEIRKVGDAVGFSTMRDRLPDEGLFTKKLFTSEWFPDARREYERGFNLRAAVDSVLRMTKHREVLFALHEAQKALEKQDATQVALNTADKLDGLTASTRIPTISQRDLNRETLSALTSQPVHVFSTGLVRLDQRIGGLHPGRTYVVAARTGIGKSAFLLNLLCSLARQGCHCGFVSLEMDRLTMNKRLLGIAGGIEAVNLRYPLQEDILARIQVLHREFDEYRIDWSDQRSMELADVISKISQFSRQGAQVVFVDYLQRIKVNSREPRHLQVSQIAKSLADLADRRAVAVVVASQLNREGAKTDDSPQLHHLSESTAIEESADVVLLLNPKTKDDPSAGRNRAMTLNVAKNRHGSQGYFELYQNARQFRFSEEPFALQSFPRAVPQQVTPRPLIQPPVIGV